MNERQYKIRYRSGGTEFEVEGDKEFVIAKTDEFMKQKEFTSVPETNNKDIRYEESHNKTYSHLKEFLTEKKPASKIEATATIVYYLEKHDNKPTVNKEGLEQAWRTAGIKPPKAIWQTLLDGKKAGWYDEVSSAEYKLSHTGLYHVEHEMPGNTK